MSFLPDNYQAPKTSSYYMKLQEGENRIRIMSKPVFGWEDWQNNKPVRYAMDKKPLKAFDPKKPVKHFWAFVVFNYQEEQIQIMHVTQATIRKSIESLCNDKDWGSPFAYDIKIMKTGEGVDTEYSVNPVPHKPLDPYLMTMFNERPCNLNALFDNSDPFSPEWGKELITKLANAEESKETESKIVSINTLNTITEKQAEELSAIIAECSDVYVDSVHNFMKKQNIASYSALPPEVHSKILERALKEREAFKEGKKINKVEKTPKEKLDELF